MDVFRFTQTTEVSALKMGHDGAEQSQGELEQACGVHIAETTIRR